MSTWLRCRPRWAPAHRRPPPCPALTIIASFCLPDYLDCYKTRIAKANSCLLNLTAMRADGEISKDEYLVMRKPVDEEIVELQKLLEITPDEQTAPKGIDLDGIRDTLNTMIDFSGTSLCHEIIDQFVYMVRPISDISFEWYLNLNGKADVKATFTVEGRKKNCVVKLEEIEEIFSLHRKDGEKSCHDNRRHIGGRNVGMPSIFLSE